MDKETEILSRLAANHLFLAQFEPLRAVILALRDRNPELALAVLQTIVARSGRFENVLWSSSCPSPSLLTHLATLELLQFDNAASIWSFGPDSLRLRAEFLLLVQHLIDRVSEIMRKNFDLESIGKERERDGLGESESDSTEERAELLDKSEDKSDDLRASGGEWDSSVGVLDRILELGVKRLKADVVVGVDESDNDDQSQSQSQSQASAIEAGELMCLRKVIWEYPDVFDALCLNIQRQVTGWEGYEPSDLAITTRSEENVMGYTAEEDVDVLGLIQRSVQLAHLDAIKECVKEGNVNEAVSHIRFLHFDYGVEDSEYRILLQDLLKVVSLGCGGYGDSWRAKRENLLMIYGAALASNCRRLIQMLQVLHDNLLLEEIELYRSLDNSQIPPPLECFQKYVEELNLDPDLCNRTPSVNTAVGFCLRDMYHFARVSGRHVLECVMDAALSAVKREQLQEASNILSLFPRLQPLVAAMGWDLLSGKTTGRRELMQLLWTSKSQVLRLEESSLYGNESDEISCVEHLCDTLCYQLDLASFVACVNSGRAWNSKFSIMLSRKEQMSFGSDEAQLDPFVQNFVLERLSVQSPLRVLFDVVPLIDFKDAIKLISMQPIASNVAAWQRMQDIELMHMRYALESAILALRAMEKSMGAEGESHHQEPFCHLKDLQSHLDAITNIPRKDLNMAFFYTMLGRREGRSGGGYEGVGVKDIMMVNVIISLLHMDYLSLKLGHCVSFRTESPDTCAWEHTDLGTSEGGNKMVISFTGLLLDILRHNVPSSVTELQHAQTDGLTTSGRHALEWRLSIANRFIEEWEWRLSILQRLLPLAERQWRWEEALTVLRAAPSKLLNLCMQRAKYDIGEEAVHRFSLPAEDKATLELAEWVDNAVRRASVEDVVSRAADGTSTVQDLDFSSLRSQLGPLAAILLCIDIAATSARSAKISQQLLDQAILIKRKKLLFHYLILLAQVLLSEIYPGVSPKKGSTYWDQILEVGVISVSRRVLKRLNEFVDKDNPPALQDILSGELIISSPKESHRQGQRERTLAMLHQMIEDAHQGKRQFLSGKLHNLARAIADEETEPNIFKGEGPSADQKAFSDFDKDGVLGLGLRVIKQKAVPSAAGENNEQPVDYDVKDTGKRLFGPISNKPTTFLSQFILHIAAIGDIVDGTDTTHDFNFFSLVYEWPKDVSLYFRY
ncbi:hypothetical protein TorRG33x02_000800 [Trema orientale]|uniref:Uncharacterized protein n=1 Tax=Trema orientale TaxID=63057 RepID=A0A2P5G168_TREOI|nr:hypothetical protein TorRG33x02_000800 [Trema orientale]